MFKLVGCVTIRSASSQSGSGAITKWDAEGEGLSRLNKAGPPPQAGASTPGSATLGHTDEGGTGQFLSPAHPDFREQAKVSLRDDNWENQKPTIFLIIIM